MGWDVTQVGKNITTKKYLEWEIKRDYPQLELVKLVEGKNQYGQKPFFAAFKKEDGTIFAAVFLTKRRNGSVAVKVVAEDAGPWDTAPASFIKLLTPTTSPFAKEWRNRCVA
jgi:hypothetical protein